MVLNDMHNAHIRCHVSKVLTGDKQTHIGSMMTSKAKFHSFKRAQNTTGQQFKKNITKYEVIHFCIEF